MLSVLIQKLIANADRAQPAESSTLLRPQAALCKSNGMPQVSGRLCEVSRPQGGVANAFYVYCRGDLPILPHFF